MKHIPITLLALGLAALGACNRQDSGAVGTNEPAASDAVGSMGAAAPSAAPDAEGAAPGYSAPGQTPAFGQPGGAPSMEQSGPDGAGSSVGEGAATPK